MFLEKTHDEHGQVLSSTIVLSPHYSKGLVDKVTGEVALAAVDSGCSGRHAIRSESYGFSLFYKGEVQLEDARKVQARLTAIMDKLAEFEQLAKMRVEIVKRRKAEAKT